MKRNNSIVSVVIALLLIATSCNESHNNQSTAPTATQSSAIVRQEEARAHADEVVAQAKKEASTITVGEANFNQLVSYIEKNGKLLTEKGIPCDHQVTFFDSKGTRHAFVTIERDTKGNPSKNGQVNQISVWAYLEGKKDQKHSFGYRITKESCVNFIAEQHLQYFVSMQTGYDEFLAKAKKALASNIAVPASESSGSMRSLPHVQ